MARNQDAGLIPASGRPLEGASHRAVDIARTKDGQSFRRNATVWELRARANAGNRMYIDWGRMTFMSPSAVSTTKSILCELARDWMPMTLFARTATLLRFGRWWSAGKRGAFRWELFRPNVAIAFLAAEMATLNRGNGFSQLRVVYRAGLQLGLDGFSAQSLLKLESTRAVGAQKGRATREGDPEKGELDDTELAEIVAAIREQRGDAQHRLYAWLSLETGRNTLAYVLATNAHVQALDGTHVETSGPVTGGAPFFQVLLPRLKKGRPVDELLAWPVSSALGEALMRHRQGPADSPLFNTNGQAWSQWDARRALESWARECQLVSYRTRRPMHLTNRRFRITMMTNAADEGAPFEHLAKLADHADLQNVTVYVDNSPAMLMRLSQKVDRAYEPMVQHFRGRLDDGSSVLKERKPLPVIVGSAPHIPGLDVGGIGRCGEAELCRLAPPLACYNCPKFIAFVDGPHAGVERALVDYMHAAEKKSPRVAIQLAPVLAAVREVESQAILRRASRAK